MKRLILLFILTTGMLPLIRGQEIFRRFSDDPSKYPDELIQYLGISATETQSSSVQSLIQRWNDGSMLDTNKVAVIVVSNHLLDKNARPAPHYRDFLTALLAFEEQPVQAENYRQWMASMLDFSARPRFALPQLHDYILFAQRLVSSGTLHETRGTRWEVMDPGFRLEYTDSMRVYIEASDLICYAVRDSIMILSTSGVYNPQSLSWTGLGGLVNWKRAGYDPGKVYAELGKYRLRMNLSEFKADSVRYHNLNYFNYEILGQLEHKAERILSAEKARYPRFASYRNDFSIEEIYPDVDYSGGISMQGFHMVGSGNFFQKAQLLMTRKDTLVIIARSKSFLFDPSKMSSADTEVSLYIGTDSIYHPNTGMNYLVDENQVTFFITNDYQSQSPWYNSYHKLEMSFEQLGWNLNDELILFQLRKGAAAGVATFESSNVYDERSYYRLQGIDDENILITLRRFSEVMFDITFLGEEFARYSRTRYPQMQQILKRLAVMGFITYELETDKITLRQKLYDWIYASVDYIDYDVISLTSETTAPLHNAELDLTNYDLLINGVKMIRLSNAQAVYIFPERQQVTVKSNRDFLFDGVINAGLFTFFGKNFLFSYDNFKINLTDIDSLALQVEGDQMNVNTGMPVLEAVNSLIEDMTGELLIDQPDNKSGRKNYPNYPLFKSTESSYIYYDDPYIQGGVYDRERFYFEVEPFAFDSLDNFSKNGLNLKGTFRSAEIFPEMEQSVFFMQEDGSLGFTYSSTEEGLPIYQGKGHFFEFVQLNNSGLRGSGNFHYLTAAAKADDIVFHPDSLFTKANSFRIDQQQEAVQYPMARSVNNDLMWYPYLDTMLIAEGEYPFEILNDSTTLAGSLTLTPSGLSGEGKMELTNSVLNSDQFTYQAYIFDADTADLRLKSVNTDGFTLMTDNVNAHVDFAERSGLFRTNEDFSLVEFPENKYVSRLDLFRWEMDNAVLVMGSASASDTLPEIITRPDGEYDLAGPRYISVDPMQDSLSFVSNRAVYDYSRNILRGSNVTFLRVADAYIYPGDGEIVVDALGEMEEIQGANLIVNRTNRIHELYDGTVKVNSRLDYTGRAYYDYIDENGQAQQIDFHQISVDDSLNTLAEGLIGEDRDFTLNPYYAYQGGVELYAENNYLTFDGGAKIFQDCPNDIGAYMKFRAEITPEDITLPVPEQPLDINMNYIYSGIFLAPDSAHVYASFNGRKKLPRDNYIISSQGFMQYDREAEEYVISSREKLENPGIPGNLLKISRRECLEYGEGKVDTRIRLGQVRMRSVGSALHNLESFETELDIALALNFFMSDEAMELMANEIDNMPELEAVNLTDPAYNKVIAELVGKDRADALQAELGLYGAYQTQMPELTHTLFITHVKLRWNQEYRSYRSEGKISLGSINGNQINKMIDGKLELSKKRSGDLMDLHLELDERNWYYFGYTRGVMHVLSTNREFNNTINELKVKQRKMKTPRNQIPYVFIVATPRKKAMFLQRWETAEESQEPQ